MLFLAGGADTFNMLVPRCDEGPVGSRFSDFVAARGSAAVGYAANDPTGRNSIREALLEIRTTGQPASGGAACAEFGVHHYLPDLTQMYAAGEAAFFANIGNLVAPVTKETLQSGEAATCPGLFSHSG